MTGGSPGKLRAAWSRLVERVAQWVPGVEARRRARESEARLRLALDAAGMAIWEMDAETGVMWWSAQAGRLFGIPDEEVGARARLPQVVERIHPDDRASFQAAVAEAAARAGEIHQIQSRVVRPDGTIRWIEARGQAWLDSEGRLRGLRGTVVDVSELKRREEELRRHLEELRVVAAVAECAAEAGDEEALLAGTTAIIRDAFFPESCGFLLRNEEDGLIHRADSFHPARERRESSPPALATGVVAEVAVSGEARRIADARSGPDSGVLEPGMRSEVCVPLKVGTRVIGILDAQSTRVDAFSERDERLLLVVASHVANALERLRGAEALRRSSELYRAYFTASPLAVFVSDTQGRYLEVNGAATALTGYSREELLRMGITDLLTTEEGAGLKDRLTGLLALGSGRHEIRIRRKDSSVRHCLVHATVIDAGRLLGFLLDVTDRRDAEDKLKESEERYRGLSEASLEAILVHDAGRIVDVNHALCELGGYSWHELIGRNAFELIVPEDQERVYRSLLVEHHQPYVITILRRDGARVPVELRARSFPFRGQLLRVVALRDISERKRAEELRESLISDLEAKNAELERFTHTVSHDLKAPLITIRGFVEYLLRDLEDGRADRVTTDARHIAGAAGQMQRLLDHLVELSRAGRAAGAPAAVALQEVVSEALRLVEGRRADSGVLVEVAEGLPVVYGDYSRLIQVFQNLLDNAVKFTAGVEGPRVRVEPGPGDPGEATVVVRDNGRGIDPAHHQRVFGIFEKLDPRAEGTGVGLAVVKRIVETHGGRARVTSRGPGCGTEVWITLPTPPKDGREGSKDAPTRAAERPVG